MDNSIENSIRFLNSLEMPTELGKILIISGLYMEKNGGVNLVDYWNGFGKSTMRDEFYIAVNFMISMLSVAQKESIHEWRLKFDVPYLYFYKLNLQTAKSIDYLVQSYCYADAFSVLRTLHSRLNLIILFSLDPLLFDDWMKNPKEPKFLDGHIRNELENHNIDTMSHIYEFASEIVHSQFLPLGEIGHMEKGIFVELKPITNRIYVLAKFIFSMIGYIMLSIIREIKDTTYYIFIFTDLFDMSILSHNGK